MSSNREQDLESAHNEEETTAVRVECYAGHRAEESPRRFFIGKRVVKVTEIIDRWLDPTHSYFKVHGDDGGIYILHYDQDSDSWEMVLFDSGTRDETRLSST
jgi:hypothetical protein